MKGLREREVRRRRQVRDITPQDLALDIVKDDPEADPSRLIGRWVRQVREDSDMLDAALATAAHHAITVAISQWRREQHQPQPSKPLDQQAELRMLRAATEMRLKLFKLKAENGKEIGDLTDKELERLEKANTDRANLYRQLRKRMTGSKTVRDAWDVDSFTTIADKLGQLKDLTKLFD